jgi:hypothetical protein
MKLDRRLQRQVLEQLREFYPDLVDVTRVAGASQDHFQANLFYLEEQGLILGSHEHGGGSPFVLARITAEGLDFLEGDGGVGAIRSND